MTGLGRIHRPNPRDRDYLFERLLPEVAPTGAKLWDAPILYNQGDTPRCTGYSAAGFLSTRRFAEITDDRARFDADAIYAWANAHDGDASPHDGSTVRAAFQAMTTTGGKVTETSDAAADPVGAADKLGSYLWADMAAANHDVDRIATWLLTIGPVVIGIPWYDTMFTPDGNGVISPRGNVAGGHAIMIRGYNSAREAFVFRNSWGPWGVTVRDDWTVDTATPGGDALISRHDLIRLLGEDGEAGAAVPDVIPAPTPPAPVPTPKPAPPIPDPTPAPVPPAPTPNPPTVTAEQIKADVQATLAAVVKLGDDLASYFGSVQ